MSPATKLYKAAVFIALSGVIIFSIGREARSDGGAPEQAQTASAIGD